MDGTTEIWLAAITVVSGGIGYACKRAWDRLDKRMDGQDEKIAKCEQERAEIDKKADALILHNHDLQNEIKECTKDRAELREMIEANRKIAESHRVELTRVNEHLEFTDKKVEKVIEVLPDVK